MHGFYMKSGRRLLLSAMLVGVFATPMVVSAAANGASTPQAANAAPSDADLGATKCAIGEERFLPGDYFYCLATQNYGEQHYTYAKKFFTEAAGWASKPAQYVLGIMALDGDHQPVNRPLAIAWLALASERPQSDYALAYKSAYASATATERQAAEQLLVTMRLTYADATAAVRAEKRYADGMAELTRMSSGEESYCMEGLVTPADPDPNPLQCLQMQPLVNAIDKQAANVFDGWAGHVSVGVLQPVHTAAPSKSGG